jgi:hypothetical protein
MTVAKEIMKGFKMKNVIFDAADSILFTNLILPSTAGYTGLLRCKYSFTMSVSVISKELKKGKCKWFFNITLNCNKQLIGIQKVPSWNVGSVIYLWFPIIIRAVPCTVRQNVAV